MAGDAVAQRALEKGGQLVSFCSGTIREDLAQELLKARRAFIQAAPHRWDDGPNVLFWPALAQFARVQVKHSLPCTEQPGVGIPLPGGDAEVGLGVGEDCLGAPQRLEGFGAFDEHARCGFEPFVVFDAWVFGPTTFK